MLCPAILDPFEGQNYRLFAVAHQSILCPLLCKIYCYLFQPVYEDEIGHSVQTSETLSASSIGAGDAKPNRRDHHHEDDHPHPMEQSTAINQNHCDNPTQSKAIPHLLGNSSSDVISKKLE